jgi:hypothetical protein
MFNYGRAEKHINFRRIPRTLVGKIIAPVTEVMAIISAVQM